MASSNFDELKHSRYGPPTIKWDSGCDSRYITPFTIVRAGFVNQISV
jgi:hypothetical protein